LSQNDSVLRNPQFMKHCLLFFVIIALLSSCGSNSDHSSGFLDFAPDDTSVFVHGNSLENVTIAIEHNLLLQELSNYSIVKRLEQQLEVLKHFKMEDEFLMCLSKIDADSLDFTLITKYKKDLLTLDSIPNLLSETFTSKKRNITKTTIDDQTLFSTVIDSVLIGSNSLSRIENISSKNTLDPELKNLHNASSKERSLSVILNLKGDKIRPSFFNDDALNQFQFSNYLLLDVNVSQDNLVANGLTKANDSLSSFINVFEHTIPHENNVLQLAPGDTDYLLSYTYSNFKTLNENLEKIRKKDSIISSTLLESSNEIGLIKQGIDQAIVLKSIDASMTQESMDSQDIIETFRDVEIYDYNYPNLLGQLLFPLINYQNGSHYIVLEDFFVFSDSTDFLKKIISSFLNKTTLNESSHFKNLMLDLSDASSIFIYNNTLTLNNTLDDNFGENANLKIDAYKASAIQFIYENDFAHVNMAIKTYKSRGVANSVSEDLDITLDAELLLAPQLFTNYTNNQKDIVVQDINNNLYLISNQGKIYWKKQLDGRILGKIEQMDIYKNGRLQLVFATPHRVYVLDRNGRDVSPFPMKFNDEITQPLSLFDYDNNKNYRLLVTQGPELLMYDRTGKSVSGFNYKKESGAITSQPKHFRIGRKDYIVFSQGNKMKILDRTGKTRINVKDDIDFSKNGIYLYNDDFVTTNNKGILIEVDQNGRMKSANLNLNAEHYITSTSKTLVTLSENQLTIKSRAIELDYGDYTEPQIFYINDKIYVTTTDLQAKKIYLFDSLGKPIANFPIYGNSAIAMDNIDKDRNLEVVTKGENNSIIIYKIN